MKAKQIVAIVLVFTALVAGSAFFLHNPYKEILDEVSKINEYGEKRREKLSFQNEESALSGLDAVCIDYNFDGGYLSVIYRPGEGVYIISTEHSADILFDDGTAMSLAVDLAGVINESIGRFALTDDWPFPEKDVFTVYVNIGGTYKKLVLQARLSDGKEDALYDALTALVKSVSKNLPEEIRSELIQDASEKTFTENSPG